MTSVVAHVPLADRTRANTWPALNEAIDRETRLNVDLAAHGTTPDIDDRVDALNREWDFDRVVEVESAVMGFLTLTLAVTVDRRLLVLPAFVCSMVLLQAVQGWYPLLPLLRRMRVRTRHEIDRERYALKVLRGDFAGVSTTLSDPSGRAVAAWSAVCA
jgi:hypothetical protein